MAKVELKQPVVQAIAEDIKDAASVVLVDCENLLLQILLRGAIPD